MNLLQIVRLVYEAVYNLQGSENQLRALEVESQLESLLGSSFCILYFWLHSNLIQEQGERPPKTPLQEWELWLL